MLINTPGKFPKLKALYFLTNFKSWGDDAPYTLQGMFHRHGFQVKPLGELRELQTVFVNPVTDEKIPVNYFAHLDEEKQLLTCFTQATSEQIQDTIAPLSGEIGIYHLWISPIAFDQIKSMILGEHPYARIKRFHADRHPAVGFPAKLRPEVNRSFTYRGEDGKETLEELRYHYGVLPRYIDFSIPGLADFRANNRGIFHYLAGQLDCMFGYAERAVNLVIQVREILEHSKLEVIPLTTERGSRRVPYIVPWWINFKRTMDVRDGELLLEQLEDRKFSAYDTVVTEGSVHLDATVLDEQKRSIFMISSDGRHMGVTPRYQTGFDSFLRFYESVAEYFDPDATCVATL
jgi:hypothetical protein